MMQILLFRWVGWKNESTEATNSKPVEIILKFDQVRNFTAASFHCNNMFSKDVRVFRKAELSFSVGGKYYNDKPVVFDYLKDTLIEYSRKVTVPIPHKIGKYVRVRLYFEARWIMISEVEFTSGET